MEVREWYEELSDVELVLLHFRTWLRSQFLPMLEART
jgi:hypothetical protein